MTSFSEYHGFDAPLKMKRTRQRRYASLRGPTLRAHRDRRARKQAAQLDEHLFGWKIAVKQVEHFPLEGMIGNRTVDLQGLRSPSGSLLVQALLSWFAQQTFQVSQQHRRLNILPNRFGRSSAEMLGFQSAL